MKKINKRSNKPLQHDAMHFTAVDMLHDPQEFAENLFKQLDKLCKKQCAAMGFDYFFHNEGAPDYFQYYHDDVDHSENAEILGDKLAMPTGDYADYWVS